MARPSAQDEDLWRALEQVNLAGFYKARRALTQDLTSRLLISPAGSASAGTRKGSLARQFHLHL